MSRRGDSLFALLVRACGVAHREAADLLMERGLSPLEAWLLEEIPADGRLCASALAQQLEVPTSTVTRALRRLQAQGYVELKKGLLYDARVLLPRLTAAGQSARRTVLDFEQEVDRVVLKGSRPAQVGSLLSALLHITERRFEAPAADGRAAPERGERGASS